MWAIGHTRPGGTSSRGNAGIFSFGTLLTMDEPPGKDLRSTSNLEPGVLAPFKAPIPHLRASGGGVGHPDQLRPTVLKASSRPLHTTRQARGGRADAHVGST